MKNTAKNFMFYVAFVASLGGLLFGFDTAVISGAEKSIQVVYDLSDFSHGFTIAIALIGTIIGAFVCSKPVEKHGRLKALKIIAFLYFVSAVGSAAIIDWYSFLFFRFAGGLAVGASSVVGPMYIAEISPSRWRGRFVAFFQFNIVLGIVLAYFSNYWIHGIAHDWQWMLGVEAIPAIAFALLLYTVPESPRWLVKQDREAEARHVIKKVSNANIEQEIHEIKESLVTIGASGEKLFQHKYRKPILYAFLIATFNQLSGINAILYYAPRIFEMSGVFTDSAMMQSIVIGLTNLTFTMIGMILIDQVGRKKTPLYRFHRYDLLFGLSSQRFLPRRIFRLLYAYLPDGVYRFLCHFTGCRHLGINLRSLPKQCALQRASIRQHDTLGVVRPPFMDVSRFHPYRRYLHFQFLCHYDVPKLLLCSQATRNKEQVSGADTKGIDQLTTYE